MKTKLILIFSLTSLFCYGQQNNKVIFQEKMKNERINMKNYAFCQCLKYYYKEDSTLKKDGSTSGFFQLGAYNLNAYDKIDDFTKSILKKELKSFDDSKLGLMKCLYYYNSKELNILVNSLDNEIDLNKLK